MDRAVTAPIARASLYRGYRLPPKVISHALWLYFWFHLSHRDVEDLLAERSIVVSYEAIRLWCRKFGPVLAVDLRRNRARAGDHWHLDEVPLKIDGKRHWLWRAVDGDGLVLAILVQQRRDEPATETFMRRVLDDEEGVTPRVVATDKLASFVPALKQVLLSAEHRRHKCLNNRTENSHRPVRSRERVLQPFKSPEHAQQFLEPFSAVHNYFRPRRRLFAAKHYRQIRTDRLHQWQQVVRLALAA